MNGGDGEPLAAVLLAGGQSRRMGRDKALLPLPDGQLFWQRQLGVLRALDPAELFIAGFPRTGFPTDVPLLADAVPGCGPLGGIAAALEAMRSPRLVVLAIDLPRMTTAFLHGLLTTAQGSGGVIPRHAGERGYYEPLAAVYPAGCLGLAKEKLAAGDWAMHGFIRNAGLLLRAVEIAAGEEPLFENWNEPGLSPERS